ncbi:regulatory signaling modulator protein AmpE [Marinobacter fonticola]|uniref:regulatory signaling modulator protein AmpE n=1 Tax=Marinobacter fonticola TaxID=2603215 RepID=UPI0011E6F87E|nr:regulatory signaling modulator protein AmpE [Marinobacter fonticola]
MSFIILLVAYGVRRLLDSTQDEGLDPVLRRRLARMPGAETDHESRPALPILLLAVPIILVALIDIGLSRSSWWMLTWPLDLMVLVFAMGVPGWRNPIRAYGEAWRRGDAKAAWHHVNHLIPAEERGAAAAPEELHRSLARQLILIIFERYFLLIFWYVLLGPAGVIGVRLLLAWRDHWPNAATRVPFARFTSLMAWVPARLLSFSFGIAGDLSGWLSHTRKKLLNPAVKSRDLLFVSANGALSSYSLDPERFASAHPGDWPDYGERSLRAVRDLLNRSMLVWICVLALLAISGVFV